jgi:hypothetical protein
LMIVGSNLMSSIGSWSVGFFYEIGCFIFW